MAAGMALTVAQTLFAALQCPELRELGSMFLEYNSRLENLQRTVKAIKNILLDAESKHLNNEGRDWIEKLKDAVYDADDLFDELITKAQQKRMSKGKVSRKVGRFFSNENQLLFGFSKSREIKKLREKLDGIANDRQKFGIYDVYNPVNDEYKQVKRTNDETSSYVYETNIIGRNAEREHIVEMILSNLTSSVCFLSIVGMGGLGKTTLAQLVFNDQRVKDTFGEENMYWVCVSEKFGLKEILLKLCDNKNDRSSLEDLQREVRKKIEGKSYLLVLDDVWEESSYEWLQLKEFLCLGRAGTQIIVTTRSREVAASVDKDLVFELKGLSENDSWSLFRKIAFGEGDDHDIRLVEIGKDIVKKCANVPLSIKVISSLLHGRGESKWEAFRNMELANMRPYGDDEKDNIIMSKLMFSYYNLTPELKSCFSFCPLFPKDYKIKKEQLIGLWLAQGYLVPSHKGESMEEVGTDYFWILLQRCFFQDVELDQYGEIHSCKMHDLMHDLAQEVAGKESSTLTNCSDIDDLNWKLRHLSTTSSAPIDDLFSKDCPSRKTLRTFFKLDSYSSINVATVVSNYKRLRVLHVGDCNADSLPEEVGTLLHLRYLDLSDSASLKMLPRSITNLHNLQILNLRDCEALIELPTDIGRLVNLRMLDIQRCSQLQELPKSIVKLVNLRMLNIYCKNSDCREWCNITYMPAGMDKLRNLHTLTYFAVGGNSSMQVQKGELLDLKGFICLGGHLRIQVGRFSQSNMPIATKGADILRKARLNHLKIICEYENDDFVGILDQSEYHETLLEGLYPNNDLSTLVMSGYQGRTFPHWGSGEVSFPAGIVRMELRNCVRLKHLSSLSKLVCLKHLYLVGMEKLEYIESDVSETFFPSLEELYINRALKLRGCWRDVTWKEKGAMGSSGCLVDANGKYVELLPAFTRLHHLEIQSCKRLKYFPLCPHLKKLHLSGVNATLTLCMKRSTYLQPSTSSSSDYSTL